MTTFFLDASYILALEIVNDQYHQRVFQHWKTLEGSKPFLVTTSYVFDEVVTFLNSRKLHSKALDVGNHLLYSPEIQLIQVDSNLFFQGWEYFLRYDDKTYSLTDCLSFLVMKQLNIPMALTLDNHFSQAGFQKLP